MTLEKSRDDLPSEALPPVDVSPNIRELVFRTLVDMMPDRIYAKDAQSRFIFANKAVAYYMADTPEGMIGKTDFDYYAEELAAQYFAVEQALIRTGEPLIACEQLVPDLSTGQPGWLQTTKVHLRDQDGNILGIVGIARNITERKRIDAELLRRNQELTELNQKLSQAQEQLLQSEKLASIGQLAAGVAHEINNPIGFIFSNFNALERYLSQLLTVLNAYIEAEGLIASPEAVSRLKQLRESVDLDYLISDSQSLMAETREGLARVRSIVKDLKDFSHVDHQSEWVWSDLHRGIDSTLNILASDIKHKADVVTHCGDIPEVECLSSQMNQVIMNLVVNAVHAIGAERGTITIRTGTEGPNVWIEIADTGCGIPADVLPRIFDPFFTTKPVGQGTGLGLSLSYGIVQRHHGRLTVTSEPGKGSCFRVMVPIKHPR